jgi:hypothetical protein
LGGGSVLTSGPGGLFVCSRPSFGRIKHIFYYLHYNKGPGAQNKNGGHAGPLAVIVRTDNNMAIYQYNIDFLPRQSIVDKYGQIPQHLFIDHVAHEKHWDKPSDSEFDFEDALTIRWWDNVNSKFSDIEPLMNVFTKPIDRSGVHSDTKRYGDDQTSDIFISLTAESFINEFSCRIDLRVIDKAFIENLFIVAKRLDCLLMDRKGNLFEPTFDKLIENIKQSNSFKFVSNPTDFLDKLSTGQIKPE